MCWVKQRVFPGGDIFFAFLVVLVMFRCCFEKKNIWKCFN